MIGLLLSPLARYVAVVAFALAIIGSIYAKGRIDGRDGALAKIEAANRAAESAADAAERCVLAGKWNKEAGKCRP